MGKINCWEFTKCGREDKGKNASKSGACPASFFQQANGFCEGTNGGRSCRYISEIFGFECNEARKLSLRDVLIDKKTSRCENCDFHKNLKDEYGERFSSLSFRKYIVGKKD